MSNAQTQHDSTNENTENAQGESAQSDEVPSLFDEMKDDSGIDLASEEIWVIKDLGLPAGFMTDGYIASHPEYGFYLARFQDNYQNIPQEAVRGNNPDVAIPGNPQRLVSTTPGKLHDPETGRYVGRLMDYTRSTIDISRDNPGNVRLLQERSGGYRLTSGRNNARGSNLNGHFREAKNAGDLDQLKGLIEYLWYGFRQEIEVAENGLNFRATTERTRALKGLLLGSPSTNESTQETPQTSLQAV